jgi:hypothetical protein
MNHSESIANLAGALATAQGSMTPAKMDSTNPFLKNKYADLGSVIQAARQPLAVNGLSFTQSPTITENQVTVTTMLMHKSGEWIESSITLPLDGSKGLSLAQSMGAIITYLRRYSLSAIMGIYADEDTDGNEKPGQKSASQSGNKVPAAEIPADVQAAMGRMTGEKEPRRYGDLDTEKLQIMVDSMNKANEKPETTDEQRAERAGKIADARKIMAWRASQK